MDNVDLNLYKIFLHVYRTRSLTKAAEICYISQPAVTYSLKQLETQLGVNLFYRISKGVQPTDEAKELYYYISNALSTIISGQEAIKDFKQLETGHLKIGAPSHIGIFYLTKYIETFHQLYPKVKIDIVSKSTTEMVYMLETRDLDIVIDTLPIRSKGFELKIHHLKNIENCFVCTRRFRRTHDINTLKDLEDNDLIVPSATSSVRLELEKFLEKQEVKIKPMIEAWTTEMMLEMVKKDLGIGYFFKDVVTFNQDSNLEILDFNMNLPIVDISIAYIDKFLPTSASEFLKIVKEGEK